MQAHEQISAALRAANEAGRPALVPFITAGYPEPADFISTLIGADTATRATTPVHYSGFRHFHEIIGKHIDKIARLFNHAATPGYLAGVVIGNALCFPDADFQAAILAEFIKYFEDMSDLEIEWLANQVGAFPANRHIGVATFRADNRFYLQFFCRIDNPLYQYAGNIRNANLYTAVCRFISFTRNRPADTGLVEYFCNRFNEFREIHDFHG